MIQYTPFCGWTIIPDRSRQRSLHEEYIFACQVVCSVVLITAMAFAADVVVNGVLLDKSTVKTLERQYGVPIKPGRYWYDNVSGVWGFDGKPGAGQIHPGLRLGGPLQQDASKGNTGVIVNGRELHQLDVVALQRCLVVVPGRYWVLANGIGGLEGGPAQFNLAALCGGGSSGGSSMKCEDYGEGNSIVVISVQASA